VISIDGTTGHVYNGAVPVSASRITQYFNDELSSAEIEADPLIRAVDHIIFHADSVRKLRVRANADNGEDAARARRMGAEGVGLARTEHMFLGERRALVERLILSETESERQMSLDALLPFQVKDFKEILDAMDGLPVIIRLIDPPLHEFLPDFTELSIKVALQERDGSPNPQDVKLLAALNRMHEANPMLGLRGVRLGIMFPGLFALQISAIVAATIELIKQGKAPHPEIMVPLVSTVAEFDPVRKEAEDIIKRESAKAGVELHIPIGTMIEVPRAALTAERIAQSADFFSYGTNDLTQTTWGFSRDDVEAAFFSEYLDRGIFGTSPFESIDPYGVGELVRIATQKGRSVKPNLPIGICGEHGGDPRSIHFFHEVGLDYVSASPYRVPVARLEAARAALGQGTISTTA
jgi:pyruvate,orthophosphate dikinase